MTCFLKHTWESLPDTIFFGSEEMVIWKCSKCGKSTREKLGVHPDGAAVSPPEN